MVSSPELDTAVDAALDAGALGARMIGGGFGGSALALVRTERLPDVIEAVGRAALDHRLPKPDFLCGIPPSGGGAPRLLNGAAVPDRPGCRPVLAGLKPPQAGPPTVEASAGAVIGSTAIAVTNPSPTG